MRRFVLMRSKDPSGVSGLGLVCEGVQFRDGTVVTRWVKHKDLPVQTAVWDRIEDVEAIHGHSGATTVLWIDEE